jgi:hypothetical protein
MRAASEVSIAGLAAAARVASMNMEYMPVRKPGTQEICANVRNLLMKILPP